MSIRFIGIFTKTIMPIIGVFGIGVFALIFIISHINKQSSIDTAINNAKSTIAQYMILRSYYTKNVVEKVRAKSNLQITFDHRIRENAIPLPATVIHDLSSLMTDNGGVQLRLYSAFPFPNRNDRVLDNFAKDALRYFEHNPDGAFVKTELTKGSELVRVAVADKMVTASCVTCHNNHPQTPRKGWKFGDVRGVLEVIIPIDNQIKASKYVTFTISYIIGIMFLIIVISILILFRWNITLPLKKFSNMSLQIAEGNLDTEINIKSKDEIGQLVNSFNKIVSSLHLTSMELKRSNEELSKFAHIASHDLKEPLRKVRSFAGILNDDFSKVLGETGKEYLDIMSNSCIRMQKLIDNLLVFSRVTTRVKHLENVDLKHVAKEVVSDLQEQLKETGGNVKLCYLPIIKADHLQMRQLLQNLISNALKYQKNDIPPFVKVYSKREKNLVLIIVEDNGIGFDEKYAKKIFGIFQRLHGKHEKEYKGTGVGLAICKTIVERHKGKIIAQSQPGKGSKFIITLPPV